MHWCVDMQSHGSRQFVRYWLGRFVCSLSHVLLGLAVVIIVVAIAALVFGLAGSLNQLIVSGGGWSGAMTYHPDMDPDVMSGIMNNFYPGVVPLVVVAGGIMVLFLIWLIFSAMAWVGRRTLELGHSLFNRMPSVLIVAIIWAVAIVASWAVLNVSTTLFYLLTECGLLLVNVLLLFLCGRLRTSGTEKRQ